MKKFNKDRVKKAQYGLKFDNDVSKTINGMNQGMDEIDRSFLSNAAFSNYNGFKLPWGNVGFTTYEKSEPFKDLHLTNDDDIDVNLIKRSQDTNQFDENANRRHLDLLRQKVYRKGILGYNGLTDEGKKFHSHVQGLLKDKDLATTNVEDVLKGDDLLTWKILHGDKGFADANFNGWDGKVGQLDDDLQSWKDRYMQLESTRVKPITPEVKPTIPEVKPAVPEGLSVPKANPDALNQNADKVVPENTRLVNRDDTKKTKTTPGLINTLRTQNQNAINKAKKSMTAAPGLLGQIKNTINTAKNIANNSSNKPKQPSQGKYNKQIYYRNPKTGQRESIYINDNNVDANGNKYEKLWYSRNYQLVQKDAKPKKNPNPQKSPYWHS